jgi:hypothetical protein
MSLPTHLHLRGATAVFVLASLMGLGVTARRRWFGVLVLLTALLLLIAGETILRGNLRGWGFLLYWSLCFVFTGLAIVVAWLDARAVQRKSRLEARELVERTLGKIEDDVRRKSRPQRPEQEEG